MQAEPLTTEQRPTIYKDFLNPQQSRTIDYSRYIPEAKPKTSVPIVRGSVISPNQRPLQQTLKIQPYTTFLSPQTSRKQNYQFYSPIVQQPIVQQPIVHEMHYNEKPFEVVPKSQVEQQYKIKQTELEEKIYKLELENIRLRSIQASEKLTISEDVTRVEFLTKELERYIKQNRELQQEVEGWRQKLIDFESQVSFTYGIEIDYIRVRNNLQETEIVLRAEINEQKNNVKAWEQKYHILEKKLAQTIEEHQQVLNQKEKRIKDLMGKIALLTSEMERMNVLVSQKQTDIDKWKKRFNDQEVVTLERDRTINQLGSELENIRMMLDQSYADNSLLKQKMIDPQLYQNKITLLDQEIERLKNQLDIKLREEETHKTEILKLRAQARDDTVIRGLKDQISALERENNRLQRGIEHRDQIIEEQKAKITELINLGNQQQKTTITNKFEQNTTLLKADDKLAQQYTQLKNDFWFSQQALKGQELFLESLIQRNIVPGEAQRKLGDLQAAIVDDKKYT
ncbi:hypothetical protein pb186bvf_004604 [Paramecium bursaria]